MGKYSVSCQVMGHSEKKPDEINFGALKNVTKDAVEEDLYHGIYVFEIEASTLENANEIAKAELEFRLDYLEIEQDCGDLKDVMLRDAPRSVSQYEINKAKIKDHIKE